MSVQTGVERILLTRTGGSSSKPTVALRWTSLARSRNLWVWRWRNSNDLTDRNGFLCQLLRDLQRLMDISLLVRMDMMICRISHSPKFIDENTRYLTSAISA